MLWPFSLGSWHLSGPEAESVCLNCPAKSLDELLRRLKVSTSNRDKLRPGLVFEEAPPKDMAHKAGQNRTGCTIITIVVVGVLPSLISKLGWWAYIQVKLYQCWSGRDRTKIRAMIPIGLTTSGRPLRFKLHICKRGFNMQPVIYIERITKPCVCVYFWWEKLTACRTCATEGVQTMTRDHIWNVPIRKPGNKEVSCGFVQWC